MSDDAFVPDLELWDTWHPAVAAGRLEDRLVRPLDHLTAEELAETHQTWFREPSTERWRLDVFREPSQGETWICRRDTRLRRPFAEVIHRTPDGIPYSAPEIVLLYKAKHAEREKNEADFAAVRSLLNPEQRAWLVDALALVHPGHRWLRALRWPRRPGSPGRGRTGHMPRNAAAARRTRAGRAR